MIEHICLAICYYTSFSSVICRFCYLLMEFWFSTSYQWIYYSVILYFYLLCKEGADLGFVTKHLNTAIIVVTSLLQLVTDFQITVIYQVLMDFGSLDACNFLQRCICYIYMSPNCYNTSLYQFSNHQTSQPPRTPKRDMLLFYFILLFFYCLQHNSVLFSILFNYGPKEGQSHSKRDT